MKKYGAYFNKRYFPGENETEDGQAEQALSESGEQQEEDPMDNASLTDFIPDTPDTAFDTEEAQAPLVPLRQDRADPASPGGETAIISRTAVINGELSVDGDIHIYGKIKGNVSATGNLEISGKIIGNVNGNDIELNHCELKGDVNSSGFVFMDKDSLMIGNVVSQDITLDGKVKGDVAASRKVYVRSNAVIMGNIRAAAIAIDEGAALQGQVIIANQGDEDETMQISEESK